MSHHEFTEFQNTYTFSHNNNALNPGASSQYYFGSVHLPQGATIHQMDVYVSDSSATSNMSFYAQRLSLDGTGSINIASGSTTVAFSGGSTVITDNPVTLNVVDNSQYYYLVRITFPSVDDSSNFSSVRITYTLPWSNWP